MAENYLEDAERIFHEAEEALKRKTYHRVIRLSQESCEPSLKACLRLVGIEYPKAHDVSDVLIDNAERFPEWFRERLRVLAEASTWLAERRGAAMYGDELSGVPASKLFDKEDAEKALLHSKAALETAQRLLREFSRRPR